MMQAALQYGARPRLASCGSRWRALAALDQPRKWRTGSPAPLQAQQHPGRVGLAWRCIAGQARAALPQPAGLRVSIRWFRHRRAPSARDSCRPGEAEAAASRSMRRWGTARRAWRSRIGPAGKFSAAGRRCRVWQPSWTTTT